jgi:hypothetical protein
MFFTTTKAPIHNQHAKQYIISVRPFPCHITIPDTQRQAAHNLPTIPTTRARINRFPSLAAMSPTCRADPRTHKSTSNATRTSNVFHLGISLHEVIHESMLMPGIGDGRRQVVMASSIAGMMTVLRSSGFKGSRIYRCLDVWEGWCSMGSRIWC